MGIAIPQVVTEDRASGAQVIDGGLRFTGSSYLKRTPGSAGSSTYTISCWVKRSHLAPDGSGNTNSNANPIFAAGTNAGSDTDDLQFYKDGGGNNNQIRFLAYPGAFRFDLMTSMVFRDTSSWYHILANYNGTTAKIYVNGTQVTAFASSTQNGGTGNINTTDQHTIGSTCDGSTAFFRGYISQFYLIDGQALDPSYFGFTDPLTNTWRPKKLSSSVAFGTNGFYLPLDGNTPIGQDQSGRGNNWTPVNFGGSNTIEKATGALPILNTDGGGKVARVGVRTDSVVSSGLGTCVLALPLVGIKSDFSNQVDSRSTNNAVTVNNGGPVASTEQSNFYGGSFKFDGTNDYLTVGSAADWKFLNNGTPWTIELWYYVPTGNYGYLNRGLIFANTAGGIGSGEIGIGFYYISSALHCGFVGGANANASHTSYTFPKDKWVHLAGVFDGSKVKLYIDGVEVASTANLTGFNTGNPTATLNIGRTTDNYYFNTGYVQDYRIYKGAKYTQNFIPASTDPDILPHTPSGVAYSSNVALVPSTDGAVAFGSGRVLTTPSNADFNFGTGDFTVEYFLYRNSLGSNDAALTNYSQVSSGYFICLHSNSTDAYLFLNGSAVTSGGTAEAGKWIHYAYVRSGTTCTIYKNGVAIASATSSAQAGATNVMNIGAYSDGSSFINGFISNLHIVKGTALYTSNFTPPTAPISSVENYTKLLCCKSNSSATAFDVSPGAITATNAVASNFNPFNVNINTQRGQESGYATLDPLFSDVNNNLCATISDGNLKGAWRTGDWNVAVSNLSLSSGKYYWEITPATLTRHMIGVIRYNTYNSANAFYYSSDTFVYYGVNGYQYGNSGGSAGTAYGATYTTGDVIGVALNLDAGTLTFYKNGISQGVANTNLTTGSYRAVWGTDTTGTSANANFGQKPFKFPPPAGFQPLALANLPRPTIVRPDKFVGIVTYTGNGGTQSLNVGFKPDLVWIKRRGTAAGNHRLYDQIRGATYSLYSDLTDPESIESTGLTAFTSDGFSLGNQLGHNGASPNTYVAWCWKAGGGGGGYSFWKDDIGYSTAAAAGLTAGTITPTGASVNTKSGFSIVTWTGNGASNATISHGLNASPAFIITVSRDGGSNWNIFHQSLATNNRLFFTTSVAINVATSFGGGGIGPGTSSVINFTQGTNNADNANANNVRYVAYLWAEIPGFSKFGSYTGNGTANNGTFVSLGFRPALILIKRTTSGTGGFNWTINDKERNKYNPSDTAVFPNQSDTESTHDEYEIDFLSNGFKLRGNVPDSLNVSGQTYIYAAYAEAPAQNLFGGQSNAR